MIVCTRVGDKNMSRILNVLLKPLEQYLSVPSVQEIVANEPLSICLEYSNAKGWCVIQDRELTFEYWNTLCRVLANTNNIQLQDFNSPRVSTVLPGGHRFQATIGANTTRKIGVAIRVRKNVNRNLKDYGLNIIFVKKLIQLLNSDCNCIISGGTNSGKTSFLNCILASIKGMTRFVSIEDAPEIDIPSKSLSLQHIVSRNMQDPQSAYCFEVDSIMRERPDIVVIGEISIYNAISAMRLFNTGHKGVFCTIHANSPLDVINGAFPSNIQMAGYDARSVSKQLNNLIDVILQIKNYPDGKRITEI